MEPTLLIKFAYDCVSEFIFNHAPTVEKTTVKYQMIDGEITLHYNYYSFSLKMAAVT